MYATQCVIVAELLLAILFAADARVLPNQLSPGPQSDNEYQQLQALLDVWENSTSPSMPAENLHDKLLSKILELPMRELFENVPIQEPSQGEVVRKKSADSDFIAKWREQRQRLKLNHYRSRISQSLVNQIARM